jgi:cytochrome c-type biogenesis protein CcmH
MRSFLRTAVLAAMLCIPLHTFAADDELPPSEEVRYQTLLSQLRCLVCQNETIADSNAPLAADLRQQVRGMMRRGSSDADIKHYLTDRYGDFVLYKPAFKRTTWALWLAPFALLLLGITVALFLFRRGAGAEVDAAPDAESVRRVLQDRDPP